MKSTAPTGASRFIGFILACHPEHREQRIESPDEQARHITSGCINVTPDAIAFLLKKLPAKGATPLYILPEDDSKTVAYFTPPTS